MHLMEIGEAALGEGAQQIQRRRSLVVGAQHPLGIGLTSRLVEVDAVDDVAAIARQHLVALRLGRVRAGFGELAGRSEEHTSELQSLMRISYAVFSLKTKTH